MTAVNRLGTAKQGWFGLVKFIYMLVAFPLLLVVGMVTLFAMSSNRAEAQIAGLHLFSFVVWLAILLPIGLFVKGTLGRRKLLKKISSDLTNPSFFKPNSEYEAFNEAAGKYLGIDINNGTILYIHRIRQGQVDVLGLSMGDWTNREVEGNMFRLYTKIPQLPRIEISTPWAQRWFDTLGAMEHKRYDTPQPFKAYVNDHIHLLEHENKIHIPKLA